MFNRDAEQLESWMAPREAIIRSEEVEGTPEGADKLVKTHENIEKSIKQQVRNIDLTLFLLGYTACLANRKYLIKTLNFCL